MDLILKNGAFCNKSTGKRKRLECWGALQDLYWAGKVRAIGVSNFGKNHLEELFNCEL